MEDTLSNTDIVRAAVYGCGHWANRTHIPNLRRIDGVDIVAICDVDPEALSATAERFAVDHTYQDAHEMLDREEIDVLFSVVRARHRTDVEIQAAQRGIHIFSEKPQAEEIALARRIDRAILQAGVMSTVGFRERYRPLFQRARDHLAGEQIVHADFRSAYRLRSPTKDQAPDALPDDMWMSWGAHAVDYIRFMTGLDVTTVQGIELQPEPFLLPIAQSIHGRLANGAPMSVAFIQATESPPRESPAFEIYYQGGALSIGRHGRFAWALAIDGEIVEESDGFDPWLEQDRAFIEAVRTGDESLILNDYHDGLYSLAPVLAAGRSAAQGGVAIDIAAFVAGDG
jgi:predicted dehydrogenase